MTNSNHIDEGLLVRYLLNETSEAENLHVENWIQASEDNKKQFDDFLLIWQQSVYTAPRKTINPDDAWRKMQQRMQQESSHENFFNRRLILRIAAMFIICVSAGWLGYKTIFSDDIQPVSNLQIASAGRVITDTLPDKSVITVNKNSFLNYPSSFTGNTREVTLNGEAFFNIKADKEHPFIIHANDVTVKVVGTSFNIKTINGKTEVIVETGVVEVKKNSKTLRLTPKQKTVTNWRDSSLVKTEIKDKLYNYYRSREFILIGTPLHELAATLSEAYGVEIELQGESVKNLRFTATFKDSSLDEVVEVICQSFRLKSERQGSRILIYKP